MKITINGQEKELQETTNLKSVIEQFSNDSNRIIAEVNGKIVKNPHWQETPVKEGDKIELVCFVGGG